MNGDSGAFGAGVEAPADDPFRDADDDFSQGGDDPFDEAQHAGGNGAAPSGEAAAAATPAAEAPAQQVTDQPVAGVPVVDAEGEPVGDRSVGDAAATQVAKEAPTDPPAEGGENQTSPSSAETPGDGGSSESTAAAGDQTLPAEAAGTVAEADDLPDEKKDAKTGKVTHRKYLIFKPTGQGKFEQVTWYEDPQGRLVPKGSEGSRKRSACLVRSKDDALAVGYLALGAPPEGQELVAVTANYWQIKTVKPEPVVPTRSRLKIS